MNHEARRDPDRGRYRAPGHGLPPNSRVEPPRAGSRSEAENAQARLSRAVHRLNLVRFDDGSPKASVTTKAVRPKYAVNAVTTLAVGVSLVTSAIKPMVPKA